MASGMDGDATMDWQHRIASDPSIRGGKPCVRGTRIAVADVLDWLASGMSPEEIVDEFPPLTRDDVLACLAKAAFAERQ